MQVTNKVHEEKKKKKNTTVFISLNLWKVTTQTKYVQRALAQFFTLFSCIVLMPC